MSLFFVAKCHHAQGELCVFLGILQSQDESRGAYGAAEPEGELPQPG